MGSILSITEQYDREAAHERDYTRTYRRRFKVETISPWVGAAAVRNAIGITIGSVYDTSVPAGLLSGPYVESDPFAFCTRVAPRCVSEDGRQWVVEVDYGWQDPYFWPLNPLLKPIEVSWDFAQFEEPATFTEESTPKQIANTAGEPFDPPPMRDDSRPLLTVVRNERYFNFSVANQYRDAVNSDVFVVTVSPFEQYIFDPNTVKVSNIGSRRILDPNVPAETPDGQAPGYYWQSAYQYHIQDEGWDKLIDNVGLRELVGGKLQAILLANDVTASSPVPLDSAGKSVQDGTPPYSLNFKVYKSLPFSVFNFA